MASGRVGPRPDRPFHLGGVMAVYSIPLRPMAPAIYPLEIGGKTWNLRTKFADAPGGGWALDISDVAGSPVVRGIPVVTGRDLLGQYPHLGFGFKLYALTDGDPSAVPTWENFGVASHLYVEA